MSYTFKCLSKLRIGNAVYGDLQILPNHPEVKHSISFSGARLRSAIGGAPDS